MKKIKIKKKIKTDKPKKKKKEKKFNIFAFLFGCCIFLAIVIITLLLIVGLYIIVTAPDFDKELLYKQESTIVYDINNTEILRTGENNITLVTYDDLPEVLVDAIVATEDSRFFQHTGFDAARFLVASFYQLLGNSDAGGASTLSMQVIKNTYTSTVDTGIDGVLRKLTDIYMSIFKLENSYTKEEIIEFYVNSQWLGNDGNAYYTGITGVEQGSQYLFGKSVTDLSLAEASILAGMFQAPSLYNPYNNPTGTRNRQSIVLELMVRHGYISQDEMDAVLEIPVQSLLAKQSEDDNFFLGAAIDYALAEVQDLTGYNPYTTPMKIYTTIDPDVQLILNGIETGEDYAIPESYGNLQFGMAVTNTVDGSISALSAGIGYDAKSWNRAIQRRQPGSTAKPIFAYGPYIEHLYGSPGTYFVDEAYTYSNGTNINNWDNRYNGIITMRSALVSSRNVPALQAFHAVQAIDLTLIEDFAHGLGIDYGEHLYESASIGGFDGISPLELSAAYAAFGRGGYYIEPYSVTKVEIIETNEVIEHKYTKNKVMSAETAYLVTDMLVTAGASNVAGFTVSGTELATKTGTSNVDEAARKILGLPSNVIMDNWVASYTAEYSIATWLGYDSLSTDYYMTMANIGTIRNSISSTVGKQLFSTNVKFQMPSSITSVTVEKDTFPLQLPSANTPSSMKTTELFIKGTEPTEVSTRYKTLTNVSNVKSTNDGNTMTITWNEIETPDTINPVYLTSYFNTYFGSSATSYYNSRLSYNKSNIGTLVYKVYAVDGSKNTLIAETSGNSIDFSLAKLNGSTEIIVKSSYTIFTSATSSGTSLKVSYDYVEPQIDENLDDDTTNNDEVVVE
ncbi:MAG: transglycosylase domain-containing protein [bacterium]